MIMMPFIKVNKKFHNSIWFLFIVHNYNSIFFFRVTIDLFRIIAELNNNSYFNKIYHKIFYFGLACANKNYFNFLKGKFYLLYSNEFTILSDFFLTDFISQKSILFAIAFSGYFVNPYYFSKIMDLNYFHENNYLYLIYCSSLFFMMFTKYIISLSRVISYWILSLAGYVFWFYKVLPKILLKIKN